MKLAEHFYKINYLQSLLANLRTLCPHQKCVTKRENVVKREVENIPTIVAVFL